LLVLQTHILPVGCPERNRESQATVGDQGLINQGYGYWSEHRKQPYAWFTDQINQVSSQNFVYNQMIHNHSVKELLFLLVNSSTEFHWQILTYSFNIIR
jgi:hypothetical protein